VKQWSDIADAFRKVFLFDISAYSINIMYTNAIFFFRLTIHHLFLVANVLFSTIQKEYKAHTRICIF